MLSVVDLRGTPDLPEPRRVEPDPSVRDVVAGILRQVRERGDDALLELTERFDGADLRGRGLVASGEELGAAEADVPADVRDAIDATIERLRDLHARQLPSGWEAERDGVRYGEVVRPVENTEL